MSFYEYALKHHIAYRFETSEASINLWFDPVQMQKVIINLLSNAFKYTPAEGNITVSIRMHSQQVLLQIKDSGTGIPQESIHKIFDQFYQIDGQRSNLSLGTGIGLTLSKNIVELHKGNIRVESKVDEGKTQKEAAGSIKTSITSHYKPLWIAADRKGREEIQNVLKQLKVNGKALYTGEDWTNWNKAAKKK